LPCLTDPPARERRALASVCPAATQIYRALAGTILYTCVPYGPVAQGIEQQPSKLKVAGSNPAGVATNTTIIRLRESIEWPAMRPSDGFQALRCVSKNNNVCQFSVI
jgi:hypothetical protein